MVCQVHGDYVDISYLKWTGKVGIQWVFPEDAKVQQTSFEQIMACGFEVKYIQSAIRIRCVVDKTLAHELSNKIRNITNTSL